MAALFIFAFFRNSLHYDFRRRDPGEGHEKGIFFLVTPNNSVKITGQSSPGDMDPADGGKD
jgi:hypothetical protein